MSYEEKKQLEENGSRSNDALPFHKLLSYGDSLDWVLMGLGTFGSLLHGMAQPIGYLLLGKALNAFGNNINDLDAMVVPYVWYMSIATLPAGILEIGCWMYASERQTARLRFAFLQSVLCQEIGAFDTDLTTAKIIIGISGHMSIIRDAIGEKLGHFISCVTTFICGVVIAIISCWEVSLLTLLVAPLILTIGATYNKRMTAISSLKMDCQSQATSLVEQQSISQIRTVYAFVGERGSIKAFEEQCEKQAVMCKQEALVKGVGIGMFQTATFCCWSLIVWIGAVVVTAGRASGGDVIAAVVSVLFGTITLTYAAPDMQAFNQAKVAGKEVFQVIQRIPTTIDSLEEKKSTLNHIEGHIDIREVHFAYPSRPQKLVFQGISLSIPAGQTVALVGNSGCGKSTVISLITRFYDPLQGDIFVDHQNIKDLNLKFLRNNIGIVSQEPALFAGTIKDNIKMGNIDADDKQMENAAVMANAHSFISDLPNQYSTENPRILLLDEATSALDSEAERLVQDALEKAIIGRTTILIVHRISTIVGADMIAIIEDGRVSKTGTHQSLLETSTFYRNLFNLHNIKPLQDSSNSNSLSEPGSTHQEAQSSDHDQDEKPELENSEIDSLSQEEEKVKAKEMFFRIWFGLSKIEILKTSFGFLAAALSGISKPIFGFFIITIGVAYYQKNAKQKVGLYSLIFSLLGLLSLFTHTLQHYFFGVVGEKAMRNLREALYSVVLRNEVAWFDKPENNVGLLTSKIMNTTSVIKTVIADRMSVIVQCISSILIATTVSFIINWRMALVAWAVMPFHFIGGLIQAKYAKGFSRDSADVHHELISLASESATNIRTIASFCHEEQIMKRARISLEEPMRKGKRESIKYGIIYGVSLCLWNISNAIALWYTTILVSKRQASFEDGIRSYQIFSLTVPSITELWTLIPTVIKAIDILTPAFHTLDRRTLIEPEIPKGETTDKIEGRIDFQTVNFKYPSRPEVVVLKNFSLQIKAGSDVALTGPSGAGKSSVLALLLRFYDPEKGNILIDGKDIKEYNLRTLRRQIGLVQQEPVLFSSSIRYNICYGSDQVSEAEVLKVSKEANIHQFVSSLPDGYDTIVGEKGCQLSGGQKQRIAIARTLLKKPTILLLDEPTSALDIESERILVSALESINGNNGFRTTQITVAHRLSTVTNSDVIVVMDRGEVVEIGSHATLLTTPDGVYSKLFRMQSLVEV
ncbi:ABC transporter B family member 19-like [Cucumis melo var. makuwa]|uniref:ABC transporter B family member 19-like n=1 Tax=Cucumis melo var. makuwa TaxID=1194695 RepID=A0A5A7VE41_CUCMM|nr:ABC transporter B family member 19-like [Cucumis melo var. makuwa]TYK00891.1 ABC transporter B family member 19-like [Cucumis melo var. makuwa]